MGIAKILKQKNIYFVIIFVFILSLTGSAGADTNFNYTPISSAQDVDSTNNIGQNLTSTTNSQVKDGIYEEIVEENRGTNATYDYSLDTGSSNVDGIDNFGSANDISNAANKDATYLNFTEGLGDTSADMQGAYFQVGSGGSTDFGSSAGTIEFWIYLDDAVTGGRVWGQHEDFEMRFIRSGSAINLDFGGSNSLVGTKTDWDASHWYYIAITWDDATDELGFYWGDEQNLPQIDAFNSSWVDSVATGFLYENNIMASKSGINPVDGRIDEFRKWNVANSLSNLQTNYKSTYRGDERNLGHYYKFENSLTDATGTADLVQSGSNWNYVTDKPTAITQGYLADYEIAFTSVSVLEKYSLSLFTGTTTTESLAISYWYENSWTVLFNDILQASWNNITFPSQSTTLTLRFNSSHAVTDTTQDFWEFDYISLRTEGSGVLSSTVESDTSDIDSSADLGTFSSFANSQEKDGIYNTLTETVPYYNSESLYIPTQAGYFIIGDGSADFSTNRGTISFWINFNSVTGEPWGQNNLFEFKISSSRLTIDMGTADSLTSSTVFSIDTWYFIAVTWNENTDTLRMFIGDDTTAPTLDASTTSWFGAVNNKIPTTNTFMASEGSSVVPGRGDELRYWNTDRSLTDIQGDYNTILTGSETNLQAYFELEGDETDSGPNNYDGSVSGTTQYSSYVPNWDNDDSEFDNELSWSSIPYNDVVGELAIYAGNTATEDLAVDIWDGTKWRNLFSDLQANSWNNISIKDYMASNIYIRFKDGNSISDLTQDTWEIDAIMINYINYQLRWEHNSQSIPNQENYELSIFGYSSNSSESFDIQLWNNTSSDWTNPISVSISTTEQWYNYSITDADVISSTITWRFVDTVITLDDLPTTLFIDYAGITSYDIIPVFTATPADFTYDEGSGGNSVSWTITDQNPGTYTIYRDSNPIVTNSWSSGVAITRGVDGLSPGVYNFTIQVEDTYGYKIKDTVFVTVEDNTDPVITYSSGNIQFEAGDLGNNVTWNATDLHASSYTITQNGSMVDSNTWTSGIEVMHMVDSLDPGTYEFIITYTDESDNQITDTVYVTVIDSTPPVFVSIPSDQQYNEGEVGNSLTWNTTDLYEGTYEIYRNDSLVSSGSWSNANNINFDIDGLTKGYYNYTIIVFDNSGNSDMDTVFVTVDDNTPPSINSPSDFSYFEGDTGNEIVWTISDLYPDNYTIYRNGTDILSGFWSSGDLGINVDDLSLGTYNFTIIVFDESGNYITDTVYVTVIDNTNPVITYSSGNKTYPLDSSGNTVEWIATDLHPDKYIIYRDGTQIDTGTWISSGTISLSVDGLPLGEYNYTIVIYDTSGNLISDTLYVKVTSESVFTETPEDYYYVVGTTDNVIQWIASDANPDMYVIYLDGTMVDSGIWQNEIAITYNVDGLSIGLYNYSIYVNDTDGNYITDQMVVTVSDMPLWDTLQNDFSYYEGNTSNVLQWNATDQFPDTYVIYRNGTQITSGTWSNDTFITINIDGLSLGVYNFTIYVNDTVNNLITDSVIITILDGTKPTIDQPADFSYDEGSTGNTVGWTPGDIHADNYTLYRNGTVIAQGSWTDGELLSFVIDGLIWNNTSSYRYNFTLVVADSSGNTIKDTIIVSVLDGTNPWISDPPDVSYSEGGSPSALEWLGVDSYNDTYEIFLNNVSDVSGLKWDNNTIISYDISGWAKGTYNVTIVLYDQSGNFVVDIVWVTVTDDTAPTIDQPGNVIYVEGTTGHNISWTGNDNYNDTYKIYLDGELNKTGNWDDGVAIIYDIDGWFMGTYNVTIVIFDVSGNNVTDQVWVTINDETKPTIDEPADFSYDEGSTGNTVEWTPGDIHADNYTLYRNGTVIAQGSWTDGELLSFDIDGLIWNTTSSYRYNFTLVVADSSGNTVNNTVIVSVLDGTNPWISDPPDVSYSEGGSPSALEWLGVDNYNDTYEIFLNNVSDVSGLKWDNNTIISYDISGWAKGTYNVTIVLYDESGNIIVSTVWITVTDDQDPTSTHPDDYSYLEGTTGHNITWKVTDLHNDSYEIYLDGVLDEWGSWEDGQNLTYFMDGWLIGTYNVTLVLNDTSGNIAKDTVIIMVTEETPPVIDDMSSDLSFSEASTGNELFFIPTDSYPGTYVILEDGIEVATGDWLDMVTYTYNLEYLQKGIYTFTIVIYDSSLNNVTGIVLVTVLDETDPNLLSGDPDFTYESGDTGNSISWTINDTYSDTYEIIHNNVSVISGVVWSNGNPITIDVDGLGLGVYNYTIVFYDESGNYDVDTVFVTVEDTIIPVLSNPVDDVYYGEGETGNKITWIFTDINPTNYIIYTPAGELTGTWASGVDITVLVDLLITGDYNYTIVVRDDAGNFLKDTVFVYVSDVTDPEFINNMNNFNYTEGTTGHELSWTLTDNYEYRYLLYQNETLITNSTWISNVAIIQDIDGLEAAYYNFTIVVLDEYDNFAIQSIFVYVNDETVPAFSIVAQSIEYFEGTNGNFINWTMQDVHPDTFYIYRDGVEIASGIWGDNISLLLNIDGLSLGDYNFTIIIYDMSENYSIHSLIINVQDITPPSFITTPVDFTYSLGSTNYSLEWRVEDLHTGSYIIYLDGKVLVSLTWNNEDAIFLNIDGYEVGYYNFSISVFDSSQNEVYHSIIVRVKDPDIIDTNQPVIEIETIVHEGDYDEIYGNWTTIDSLAIDGGEITVSFYLQFRLSSTNFYTVDGDFTLLLNYTSYAPGSYYWEITFTKEGYFTQNIILYVEIIPHTFEIQLDTPSELVQGEEFYISAIVYYSNNNTNSSLGLSELFPNSGPVSGVEITFRINVLYEDGTQSLITKTAFTDENGVALVSLSASETTGAAEILSITANISEEAGNNASEVIMDGSALPSIQEGTPSAIAQLISLIEDYLLFLIGGLVILVVGVILAIRVNKDKKEKMRLISENVRLAHDELNTLQSILAIIIQTTSKLSIYEENIFKDVINTNIVGGMVTAFSSFLNELGDVDLFGFEIMERDDISLTVHKGKYSNFIVISKVKLPLIMLAQVQKAQKLIEAKHKDRFTNTSRGVRKLTQDMVHPILNEASFKVPLLYKLKLNTSNLNRTNKQGSISRSLKNSIRLLEELKTENGVTSIKEIQELYSSKDISKNVAARVIMLAYEFDILTIHKE